MTVFIRDPVHVKLYRATVSRAQYLRFDNGASVSCGWTVGEDGLTRARFDRLKQHSQLEEVTADEWAHSGCQSSCVRRGGKECRW